MAFTNAAHSAHLEGEGQVRGSTGWGSERTRAHSEPFFPRVAGAEHELHMGSLFQQSLPKRRCGASQAQGGTGGFWDVLGFDMILLLDVCAGQASELVRFRFRDALNIPDPRKKQRKCTMYL